MLRRRMELATRRINQRWGRKFRKAMIDRERYWNARRLMQRNRDMTLGRGLTLAFLNEIRRA